MSVNVIGDVHSKFSVLLILKYYLELFKDHSIRHLGPVRTGGQFLNGDIQLYHFTLVKIDLLIKNNFSLLVILYFSLYSFFIIDNFVY